MPPLPSPNSDGGVTALGDVRDELAGGTVQAAVPDAGAFFSTKKGLPVALPDAEAPYADSHTHLSSLRHIDPALALARDAVAGVRFVVDVVDPTDDARDPDALLSDVARWVAECGGILDRWAAAGVVDATGGRPVVPEVRIVVGCHPHNAKDFDEAARAAMRAILADPRCCGIGEIGLDYHYDLSPRELQREVFAEQLDLACRLNAPLSLHIREAHDEAADIMATRSLPRAGTVLHCFDLGMDVARPFLDMGCVLGIGGAVTFGRSDDLRDVVRSVPDGLVLTETDAPYMAPEPLRGTRCEPAYIALTARFIADLRSGEGFGDGAAFYESSNAACRAVFDRPAPLGERDGLA